MFDVQEYVENIINSYEVVVFTIVNDRGCRELRDIERLLGENGAPCHIVNVYDLENVNVSQVMGYISKLTGTYDLYPTVFVRGESIGCYELLKERVEGGLFR